jgi:hypothetical protein
LPFASGRLNRRALLPTLLFTAASLLPRPAVAAADGLILSVSPLYSLPLTAEAGVFSPLSLGGQVSAVLPWPMFGQSWLRPELGVGYVYSGFSASA